MGSSTIALGLGLGGGKASTSSGSPGGGAAYGNEASVALDGVNGYVAIPSSSDFGFGTDNFSISCWINADLIDTASLISYMPFDFRSGTSTLNPCLFIDRGLSDVTTTVRWSYHNGAIVIAYSSPPIIGQWYHFVYTRSSTTGTIYLNGSSVATGLDNQNYVTPAAPGRIGQQFDAAYPYDGKIDEFAIFDSALSSSDVTAIYNSGTPADIGTNGLDLSPLGWWRMGDVCGSEGTNIANQGSTSSVDGTLTGGATFSTDVPAPVTLPALTNTYSLEFDGSDQHVLIGTGLESALNSASAVTASVWFNADNYTGGACPFGVGTSLTDNFFILPWSDGNCYLYASNGSQKYLQFSNPSTGAWHHIVFIMNGASSIAYLDGVPKVVGTLASALSSAGGSDPTIGKNSYASAWYMDGNIDEVAVWNSALSGANCKALYNSGTPPDIISLEPTGWWRMGDGGTWDGSNWTIPDASDNSNAGTTANMAVDDRVTEVPSA